MSDEIEKLSEGRRSSPTDKSRADSECGICGGIVSEGSDNKFYCGERCRGAAYEYYYNDDDDAD